MKKGRKTSAVLAAMLAASTLLAGCGDSGNGAQGADGQTAAAHPIGNGKVTLTRD